MSATIILLFLVSMVVVFGATPALVVFVVLRSQRNRDLPPPYGPWRAGHRGEGYYGGAPSSSDPFWAAGGAGLGAATT